jgi:hypothetical protein
LAYATGYGGDPGGFGGNCGVIYITYEFIASFGCWVFDAIDAYIDDHCTFFDHISFHKLRHSNGGNQNVGLAGMIP